MNSHSKKDRISAMVQLHGSAALVILFSLLLHDHRPFALLLLAVAVAFILFWAWRVDLSQLEHALGLHSSKWAWYLVCLSVAVLMAGLLRWRDGYPFPPGPARPFLLMAFVVGATEEVLFRGYFLGRLRETWGEWPALTFAALYHSAYKTALFLFHAPINLTQYAVNTFLLGLLIGLARTKSGSIWPVLLGHALFDLLYYFDRPTPWWVW